MLCVALMFVFSQAAVASSINYIQHMTGADHHHSVFSEVIPEFAFHHQQGDLDDHDDADGAMPDGHTVGHHHHHGDVGSSTLVLGAVNYVALSNRDDVHSPRSDRLIVSVRHSLPERPPKIFSPRG